MNGLPLPEHGPQQAVAYGPDNAFATFLSWTDEKVRLAEALQLEIDPGYSQMLDVGAGDGSVTRLLAERFEGVTALEPFGEFVDVPPNVVVLPERVEEYLEHSSSMFDMILASHVFIYVADPAQVLSRLNQHVRPGGRMATVMLEGESEYRKFVNAFANEVNPALEERPSYKSSHLVAALNQMGVRWRRNLITTSLVAPSIDDFLSINRMHFNCSPCIVSAPLLERMRQHLREHLDDEGRVVMDLQHGIYIVEH